MDESPVLTMWKNLQSLEEGRLCVTAEIDDLERWLLCYKLTLADTGATVGRKSGSASRTLDAVSADPL